MKKFFLCLGMISFSFLICACNNKDNDIVVEELEKPSGIINESEEENIETTNGFKNVKFGEFDLYVPYIKQSQKIGGVVYLDDDIEDNQFSYLDFYAKYNKPDGCNIAALRANSMSYYHIGTPPFQEKQEEYNQTEHVSEAFTTYMDEADKKIDNTKPYNKYYDTYDVQGISFCLYEDFYETYPQITCSIYGINADVLKKYLGDENIQRYPAGCRCPDPGSLHLSSPVASFKMGRIDFTGYRSCIDMEMRSISGIYCFGRYYRRIDLYLLDQRKNETGERRVESEKENGEIKEK
mgnify:CR=1 FL=1